VISSAAMTWASARGARYSPGYHIAALQAWEMGWEKHYKVYPVWTTDIDPDIGYRGLRWGVLGTGTSLKHAHRTRGVGAGETSVRPSLSGLGIFGSEPSV
jgi:hypothetical protein